jgi:hypothetical protein
MQGGVQAPEEERETGRDGEDQQEEDLAQPGTGHDMHPRLVQQEPVAY